jgi:hypothetical protein
MYPQFLPDRNHFLYLAIGARPEASGIYVASLDSNDRKLILNYASIGIYVLPDYLLFTRRRTLMAQPFDAGRLQLTGQAILIAEGA